jgi:uncharacterized membrane protein
MCGHWFYTIYKIYGNPLYIPGSVAEGFANDMTGWFKALRSRPPGYILFTVGLTYLCPLLSLYFLSLKEFFMKIKCFIKEKEVSGILFLWIILLTFFLFLIKNNEYRRILPVFPIMAVLSGYILEKTRKGWMIGKVKIFSDHRVRTVLILLICSICMIWSTSIGIDAAITRVSLLKKPF